MSDPTDTAPCALETMQASEADADTVCYDGYETYRIMADALPQIVWSASPDGARDYFNQRWYEHTRLPASQTKGWGWISALHNEDRATCTDAWMTAVKEQDNFECEYRLLCAEDGSYRWHVERALPVFDPGGSIVKWFGTCTDIDALKQARADIETLNARLRRAMTETHHRVKNNLQIITALVDMQLLSGDTTISAEEFRRIGAHVQTLATVHDILTKESKDEGSRQAISLKEILDKLIPVHQQTAPQCQIIARVEDVALPGRQGTSLALVVNELISNAIKHGQGLVEVVIAWANNHVTVTVIDDGPGFPDGFDVRTSANTGLELVDTLTRLDLGGSVTFSNQTQGGARVTLVFLGRPGQTV